MSHKPLIYSVCRKRTGMSVQVQIHTFETPKYHNHICFKKRELYLPVISGSTSHHHNKQLVFDQHLYSNCGKQLICKQQAGVVWSGINWLIPMDPVLQNGKDRSLFFFIFNSQTCNLARPFGIRQINHHPQLRLSNSLWFGVKRTSKTPHEKGLEVFLSHLSARHHGKCSTPKQREPKSQWIFAPEISTNKYQTLYRENAGTLGMVALIINPICTLFSGYLLGICCWTWQSTNKNHQILMGSYG